MKKIFRRPGRSSKAVNTTKHPKSVRHTLEWFDSRTYLKISTTPKPNRLKQPSRNYRFGLASLVRRTPKLPKGAPKKKLKRFEKRSERNISNSPITWRRVIATRAC